MLPNYNLTVQILFEQYGHVLTDNPFVVQAIAVSFFIGIAIGVFAGLKKPATKKDN